MKSKLPAQKERMSQNKSTAGPKRDRALTEGRLLKAGTAVFSRYGYDAATTKLISLKSGVNESLIMRYFGGKEGLLLQILKRHFEESRLTPLPYPPQETLEEELIQYIRYGYAKEKKHNEITRIMLLRASVDLGVRRKVQAILPTSGDPKLLERIDMLKAKKKIPNDLDFHLVSLIGFQNFSCTFISGMLFDEQIRKNMQMGLEILVSATIRGILK